MLIFLIIFIAFIAFCIYSARKENEKRIKFNIPKEAKKMRYYEGYSEPLSRKIYIWNNNNDLKICSPKISDKHIVIHRQDIISFNMIGEFYQTTTSKGGGRSLGGAVAGGVLLGGVGAIIGSKKKVKTTTSTTDTRKVILKFKENNIEKGMILDKDVNKLLCFMCPEKKIA